MEFLIKGKTVEGKFNYGTFFRANAEFSTHDNDGNSMQDGATNLFLRILAGDLTVLKDVLPVITGSKFTDDQVSSVIDEITDNGNAIDELMDSIKEELVNSGFFFKSIQNHKKTIEEAVQTTQGMVKTEKNEDKKRELENNIKAMQNMLKLLNENI